MICPHCGMTHENARGKCPHCGSDFRGHVREKRATLPRNGEAKYRCAHGILRHRPCLECERSPNDCEVYRRDIPAHLKAFFSKSEAEKGAKDMLTAIDLTEAQRNR
jgi:hypothetical protein